MRPDDKSRIPRQRRGGCRRGRELAALVLVLSAFSGLDAARADNDRSRVQDGIVAQLAVEGMQAVVSWRFGHRPPDLVGKIEARVNGRAVGTPSALEVFPTAGDRLLVIFLIDDGGLQRAGAIDESGRAVLDTIKVMPRFVQPRVAAYDTDYRQIALGSGASAAAEMRAAAGPRDAGSDLSRALRAAIEAAAVEPATRRAIYVYTDGYNAGSKSLDDLGALAEAAGVSVSFVLTPSMRLADLALLDHFATGTGGRLLARSGFVRDDITVFLASGARIRFPIEAARHFIWERTARLDVSIAYGDKSLSLTSDVETPLAGPSETMVYAWQSDPQLVVLAGAALLLCCAGLATVWRLRRRRRRKMVVAPAPRQPLKS